MDKTASGADFVTPLRNQVVVLKEPTPKKRAGGIIELAGDGEPVQGAFRGWVRRVGPECKLVHEGDFVLFNAWHGTDSVTLKGEERVLLMDESMIIAKFDREGFLAAQEKQLKDYLSRETQARTDLEDERAAWLEKQREKMLEKEETVHATHD